MRATVRPVTLKRLIELLDIVNKRKIEKKEFHEIINCSKNRGKEVIKEAERMGLVYKKESLMLSESGERFIKHVNREEWKNLSNILYDSSPHYNLLINFIKKESKNQGLTPEKILSEINSPKLKFNQVGVSVLLDWGERLGVIQKNVFERRFYSISNEHNYQRFKEKLFEKYQDFEKTKKYGMRKRYISIPKLREYVCELTNMERKRFDEYLNRLYFDNIGKMELSGAPLDTKTKNIDLGVKNIKKTEDGEITSSKMSTTKLLDGITLDDNKKYYYISFFNIME